MGIKKYLISLAMAVVLSLALVVPVMAVPQIPHAFYGNVTVGGQPAPDNTSVSAKIGGVEYASSATSGGKYGYSPIFKVPGDDPDTADKKEGGVEGDIITFYVGGVEAASYTFKNGEVTELALVIAELPSPPTNGGGAGGGGGGGEPTYYTQGNLFGTSKSYRIGSDGEVKEKIEATSADGKLTLTINKGTMAKDKDGGRLRNLQAAIDDSPPSPPEESHLIGLAYSFGPDDATFDPPITLTWEYNPNTLPEGVDEEGLVVAYYDASAGRWVDLDSSVDTENNIITASVAHFTTFAIIGAPKPAAFTLSLVGISPSEVAPGEKVTITVSVANTGGRDGSRSVVLEINGVKEDEKTVTIAPGASKEVTFTVVKDQPGKYSVMVGGLGGGFTVVAPPSLPAAPAAFSLSKLSIIPAEVKPDAPVTIGVSVANTGGTEGSYDMVLKVNGVKEAEQSVTLAAGKSETVNFTVSKKEPGSYSVEINGQSGSFTVAEAAPPTTPVTPPGPAKPWLTWPVIGGVVGGVIVIVLIVIFLLRRRAD